MDNYSQNKFVHKKKFSTNLKRKVSNVFSRKQYPKSKNDISKRNTLKRLRRKIVKAGAIILVIAIILFIAWFLLFSKIFEFSKVNINLQSTEYYNAVNEIINNQLEDKNIIKQNNFFTLSKDRLIDSINSTIEDVFYEIDIKKHFPNELDITLKERVPEIVFINNLGRFYFDENGILVSTEINKAKKSAKVDKNDKEDDELNKEIINYVEEVYLGQDIELKNENVNKNMVSFLTKVRSKLQNKSIEITKIYLEVINDLKVVVTTSVGYDIYFNISDDIDTQIENLDIVIKDKIQDNIRKIQYIDLRFESKIYYK